MAILNHGSTLRTADGGQTTTTIVTASNIGTYGVAANSTYYVGTTQNVFNRASGAQTLTGVSIDGNAANITAYTINQNVGSGNTPSFAGINSTAMLVSYTSLTNGDDWSNSPISIRERGLVSAAQSINAYSPNLNFHWGSRISNSLWMDANGNLAWGSYSETGVPSSDGAFYAANLYASIYYDKNDTAYYVDPNSISRLSSLRVYSAFDTASSDVYANMRVINDTAFSDGMFIGYANAGSGLTRLFGGGATTGALIKYSDYTAESNSFRAPIFYDSDNTAYYLDAANSGTSLLVAGKVGIGATAPDTNLQVVGHVHVGNQTTFENTGGWNKTIYLDGLVHSRLRILGSAYASGKNSSTETYLWVDNSVAPYSGLATNAGSFQISAGFTTILNSARSPLFYDSDNTAYYIDAASTSNLVGLTVANTITGSISGNAATATNVAWSGITSKPTTLSGFGITDALPLSGGTLTGNLTITKAGAYLYLNGTNSDSELRFMANGSDRWAVGMNVGDATENLNIYNYTTATTNFTILKASGNVGIGTTSPSLISGYVGLNVVNSGYTQIKLQSSASSAGIEFKPSSGNSWELQANTSSQWFVYDRTQDVVRLLINSSGNVGIGTTDFSYTINDNSRVVGSNTNNRLFVSGSIQLLGNNDAIVFGRGTSTFLTDEELGFGWGGGWYMTDETYLRVRNNKVLYTTGEIWGSIFKDSNDTAYYLDPASTSRLSIISTNRINALDGTFLFKSGTGAGTTRHINLADSGGDPSSVGSATGITVGERSDNAAYYMIYVKAPYNNGSSTHSRLVLGWHTGMEIGANATYGGVRFMADSPGVNTSEIFSVGKSDSNVRVANTIFAQAFSDSNNTVYYTDPASTSNLLGLTVTNTITGSITGNAGGSSASCTGNAATASNSTQFGGEGNTNFMRGLTSGTEANLDTYTDNGFRSITYTGYSRNLLSFNPGGSTGTVQHEYYYNIPSSGWRVRNKTDNITWSAWGNVVMTDTNQGALTGTVITTTSNTTVSGLNIGGNAATAYGLNVHTGRNNEVNKVVRTDGSGYIQAGWINTDSGDSGFANRLTRITCSTDNYLRYLGLTDFKVSIGESAKNNYSRRVDYSSDANYHVGSFGHNGYGANETFHGGSGFFDIWSGTNYPSGLTHIHGFNALHYTTNSLGTTGGTAYGWQMAVQYNSDSGPWWRRCSGGSFSSWLKLVSYGNNQSGDIYAQRYYDNDNTVYYIDAGSTSYLYVLSVANAATAADYYTAGWFRNSTSGYGMYNQVTGQHFYSDTANYWNVASSANAQGIRLRTGGYNGTVRGYFYADTNNDVGFLNQDGSWRLRVVGGDYSLADGSSMRAQLFYDSNDTAYYVNPNSTSNLYYITMPHIGNGSANLVVNNGGSENWNAIKINGGNDNNGIGFSNTSHSAFGRNNFSFHTHNLDSIRFHSSGWDTLFEVAGSSGNAWLKGGSFDSSFTRLVNPGGAYYVTGTSTITGAIKIRLPRLNANTMMRMTVKIYQYNTGQCATIECGGYDYSGDGIWRNIFAYQNSDLFATVNVRFGNDGTYDCVWIGETSSTWSYPQVFVTDFQAGYNNYTSDWGTGWNISFVTTFNTVTDTRVAYKTLNAGNYNSYAPTLTGTGASGTWSINVTGNAATVTNGLYTSSTLTAGNLSGTIPSGVLGNSTHYVGTTAIALNRASAGQTLTGISIDGNSGGIYAAGQAFIQTTSAGTSYVQHIQVREAAGGGGLTSEIYAPALGFHWSGVVASNILMESSGRMSIRNNPGTSYENFIANIVYGNSSVQTPILYDSNDTAYYLDPRSTSVLSGLKLNGVDNEAAGTGSDAILWINKPNNNDWGIRVSGNLEYLLKLEGATSHTYNIQGMANGSEFWRCGTDLLYHNSNIRAPIFYDSNNTAYYLDPNSTTSLRTVGSWRSDSSTWDGEFSGKIQYHSNHWYFQSGDLWIFRNSGGTNVATINQSGTISAAFSGSLTGNVTGNVTGTAINIAGNGAGADPYGTIAVTEPANASNYSYYGLTRQANIGAGFGLTGTTGALGFGANAFWFGGATSTAAGVMSSAYIAFNGSSFAAVGTVDATQFRDRDNTAYYIDAASTSNLLGLTVTNTITGNISGTAGSISGFNNPTTAATANTIVYRDSGGDIYGRYLFGSYQNSSDDTSSTGITFIMAKFGDNYHRSASAAKVATFISGQTMNINGSSTSCSGTATTATTANALNTSNSYTIAGLTNNGTATLFPTYGSGYSYFLRMGYDTSGYYDYTIKRDGNTGLLEFNGTQGAPYVGYVFSGGNVGVGTTTPGYKVDVNGSCHATCFPTSSDIRFKKKITPLENSLEKIKKLQGVKYEWNEFVNSVRDGYKLNIPIIGLIAQDVEKVIPEIIDFWKLSDDCQDARSIDYPRLIPFLIEAIKEQQIIIENQNQKIENLMTRMSALEAK